ncbi:hypothetical protein [Luteolibacter soli]|uniref:Uncharacterized protein n=1 Tax=Luteolibacter soli TaxID=3135280 RepID=A0ABU9AVY0_9BACT
MNGLVDANGRIGKDGTSLYLSFLQQPNGTSLFYEFEFHRGDLGDPGRIAGIGNDRPGDNVNLRAPNNTHTLIGAGDTNVNFYVVRIDFKAGNDDVRIYRNPTSVTEPGVPTLTKLGAADMSFDGISFGAFVNGRTVMHDEIRVGTSWADAIGEDPYVTWVRESGLQGAGGSNTGFDADPDRDAIPNGLEWLLGGNPLVFDAASVWSANAADGLTLTFHINPDAISHAGLFLQWSKTLSGTWTDVPIQQGGGTYANGVVVQSNGNAVTVHVPGYNASQGKLFARLRAVEE